MLGAVAAFLDLGPEPIREQRARRSGGDMLFNSFTFAIFFLIVYALFWAIRGWDARKRLLLVASYIFYGAWSPPYVALLAFSTTLDWWLARRIGRCAYPRRKKLLLAGSLAANLMLLGYFKYGQFLLDNFAALAATLGIHYQPVDAGILLPIGISFYTFASLSYTIDVYRNEIRSDWRLSDYALFVGFFPHLVAGPIVRASVLLPQFVQPKTPTRDQIGWGLSLLIMGLFSKVSLADGIFAPVAQDFFASPSTQGAVNAWIGVLSFSGQIYYDFSGYSLCAIGLAACFGISFPDNFRHPYAAIGFSDFWRRWHISLSSWLRDYLYVPLGGNRLGHVRTYANLAITMLLGGLWHGASWLFVIWGGLHGLYLALERGVRNAFPAATPLATGWQALIGIMTFLVVTVTWIPFRATSLEEARAAFIALADYSKPPILDLEHILAVAAILATVRWHVALRITGLEQAFMRIGGIRLALILATCLVGLFLFSGGETHAFIYFQF